MEALRVLSRRIAGHDFEDSGLQGGADRRKHVLSGSGAEGAVQGLLGARGVYALIRMPCSKLIQTTL